MAIFGSKKKSKKTEGTAKKRVARASMLPAGKAHETIKAPWFSEKALLATEHGIYTFAVPTDATKAHIASAIKEIYGVTPRQVRIVNLPGRRVSRRTRAGHATRARRRKAYVYLNKGDTIQFS